MVAGACAAIVLGALVILRAAGDDTRTLVRECDVLTATDGRGTVDLGPLDLLGFTGDPAHLTRRLGQARLIVKRDTREPEPITLSGFECRNGNGMTLIAVGSPRPISIPSSFSETASSTTASLTAQYPHYVVVLFMDSDGTWQLTARRGVEALGAIVFRVSSDR